MTTPGAVLILPSMTGPRRARARRRPRGAGTRRSRRLDSQRSAGGWLEMQDSMDQRERSVNRYVTVVGAVTVAPVDGSRPARREPQVGRVEVDDGGITARRVPPSASTRSASLVAAGGDFAYRVMSTSEHSYPPERRAISTVSCRPAGSAQRSVQARLASLTSAAIQPGGNVTRKPHSGSSIGPPADRALSATDRDTAAQGPPAPRPRRR